MSSSQTKSVLGPDAEKHMERAIQLSAENKIGGPFGAVIVDENGKIIGEGANQVTSANDPTAHAEVTCIRNACASQKKFHLDGCIMYTSCEPCPMCLGAIYWAHIKTIVYANTRKDAADAGFDDAFIYDEIGLSPEARSIPAQHMELDSAKKVFKDWVENTSKIDY